MHAPAFRLPANTSAAPAADTKEGIYAMKNRGTRLAVMRAILCLLATALAVPVASAASYSKVYGQTQDKSDNLVFISFGISEPDVRIYTTVSYVPYTWGRGHVCHTRWVREEETRTKVFFHAGLLLEGCTRAPDGGRGKNLWRTEIRCTGRDDDFRTLLQAMLPVLQQHLGKDTGGRRYFVVTLDEDEAPVVEEKEVTAN